MTSDKLSMRHYRYAKTDCTNVEFGIMSRTLEAIGHES